jgi:predicted O-methyltransferase YrrM
MNFTQDWFTHNVPNFEKCMAEIGEKRRAFLEIGAYEGRSTCWLIGNLPNNGSMTSIDPFPNMPDVEKRFLENVREAIGTTKIIPVLIKATSYSALSQLIQQKHQFDFIYVDGVHSADGSLTDACMSWGLLRQGGVMLFDDYLYPHEPTKVGIDAFLAGFEGHYDIIVNNYQLAVKKK